MSDKRIYQLGAASELTAGDKLAIDRNTFDEAMSVDASAILTPIADLAGDLSTLDGTVSGLSGTVSGLSSSKAPKTDLTNISITGSTNNTGSTITAGTFFYKSGTLVRALVDIANGATLTSGTNYATVTAGGLNELNSALNDYCKIVEATAPVTLEANSQNQFQLRFSVPSGYKAILATPRRAGSWAWVWSDCGLTSQSIVTIVLKSQLSVTESHSPIASVLCIRNN